VRLACRQVALMWQSAEANTGISKVCSGAPCECPLIG
jgi:hypothetical protein